MKPDQQSKIWGTGDSFNPVAAFLYEPIIDTLKVRATFSRKTRFVTLHEFSDTADMIDQYYLSNPAALPYIVDLNQLKPETANNASAGVEARRLNRALYIREDYFFAYYEDKLVAVGDPNSNVGNKRWTNIEGSTVNGLESTIGSTLGTDLLKILEMNVSMTYVFTSAMDELGSYAVLGSRVAQVPMHQLIGQLKLDFISGTSLNFWSTSFFNQMVYIQMISPAVLGSPSLYTTNVYMRKKIHDSTQLNIRVSQRIVDHFVNCGSCARTSRTTTALIPSTRDRAGPGISGEMRNFSIIE